MISTQVGFVAHLKRKLTTQQYPGATIIVDDVEKFPGHIACSSASKSEIVVPVFDKGNIVGVLDVDSAHLSDFDEIDQLYLEKIVGLIPAL